jgi:hypothetical protein
MSNIELEKMIKKAVIVCFVTNQKVLHLSDRLGVNMIFSEPSQELDTIGKQASQSNYNPFSLSLAHTTPFCNSLPYYNLLQYISPMFVTPILHILDY